MFATLPDFFLLDFILRKANSHKVMHITIIYVQERPCLYYSDYVQQISYHGVEEFRGDISLFLAHYHK